MLQLAFLKVVHSGSCGSLSCGRSQPLFTFSSQNLCDCTSLSHSQSQLRAYLLNRRVTESAELWLLPVSYCTCANLETLLSASLRTHNPNIQFYFSIYKIIIQRGCWSEAIGRDGTALFFDLCPEFEWSHGQGAFLMDRSDG